MILASVLSFAVAVFQAQAPGPAPNHSWIADVKARRTAFISKEIRVIGVVADIRSTSLEARRGIYRLIDESDRAGILIRTGELPVNGGSFRVRGVMASQQPPDGSLVLVEVSREATVRASRLALVLTGLSVLALLVFLVLAIRSLRAERKYLVSPPLWLLPEAGPYGKPGSGAPGAPTLKYDPELEETDRRQRELLRQRKRLFARALLATVLALAGSSAWLVASRPTPSEIPEFVLIDAEDRVLASTPPARVDTLFADQPKVDTVLVPAPRPADSARRGPGAVPATPQQRRDSAGGRRPGPGTVAIAPPPAPTPSPVPPSPSPVPAPGPVPPPAPPPTPPPPPAPPPLSPEAERALARDAVHGGVERVVAAINGKRLTDLLILLPEQMAGDRGRLERFVELVKGFAPRATLGTVEPITLADGRSEARFAVAFVWRGDFGVERKKTGRFVGVARRLDEGGWRFEGARLLDPIP